MPSVLIISDTHGLTKELQAVKERHQSSVDAMIHCGDSELDPNAPELEGFYYAKGNCDFHPEMVEEQSITVGELNFFVTHGHLFQIKSTLMPLNYRAEEAGADVVCFGHSHMAGAEHVNGRLFINPGSARLPRNRVEPTYAILSWESREAVTLQYYDIQGNTLDLKYQTSFLAED
ncbi:metallophosphoesterase [Thalassobacillus hwangdonensis]|uniref:Phosphoesterase n=1 Tax=Thalassobacillus hwangdonensis TaxID=546108 RepID=A0ABW3KZH4_9BACI